ncbi:MFS transporter [Actinomadura barringtoniae]|uniref:MFS transporter n=1 Tax=Actinomadura barringtoniae TaxID=1427535 RepID=A0A939PBV9_9ACTN|nr:MFS transporter [Actinomadura barringtoniae]
MWIGLLSSLQILLPRQVERIDPHDKIGDLGLVTGVAAVAALVAAPVVGALSDRTTSRFGRRRPWVAGCSVLCSAALFALPWQTTLTGVTVCWVLVHASVNGMHTALCAAMSDRVPVNQRGVVAAVAGLTMPLGLVAGTLLVSGLDTTPGYSLVAVLVLVMALPYALLTGDLHVPSGPGPSGIDASEVGTSGVRGPGVGPSGIGARRRPFREFLAGLYVSPKENPGLAWAWGGRFAAQLSTSLATLYLFYFLRDGVRVADPARDVALLSVLYTAGAIGASVVAGRISDRVGRRRVFVVASSLFMAAALTVMAMFPIRAAAMPAALVLGAGYGIYLAIDQALVTQLLPRARDRAKDLGVMNMAGSCAVAICPAVAATAVAAGGFSGLFAFAAVLAVAGGLVMRPITSIP